MSVYHRGFAEIGSATIPDHSMLKVEFNVEDRPIGASVESGTYIGSGTCNVRKTRGGRVGLKLYRLHAGDTDHEAHREISHALIRDGADQRAVYLGDCELLTEQVRRDSNKKRGAFTTYGFTVRAHAGSKSLLTSAVLSRDPMVLLAIEAQEALPLDDKKDKKARKDHRAAASGEKPEADDEDLSPVDPGNLDGLKAGAAPASATTPAAPAEKLAGRLWWTNAAGERTHMDSEDVASSSDGLREVGVTDVQVVAKGGEDPGPSNGNDEGKPADKVVSMADRAKTARRRK